MDKIIINRSPAGDSWRLVYKGTTLIGLVRSAGITSTIHTLEIFPIDGDAEAVEEAVKARITELGLVKPEPSTRKDEPA